MQSVQFLSGVRRNGQLASLGGATVQTMIGGAGAALSRLPIKSIQSGVNYTKEAGSNAIKAPIRFFSRKQPQTQNTRPRNPND